MGIVAIRVSNDGGLLSTYLPICLVVTFCDIIILKGYKEMGVFSDRALVQNILNEFCHHFADHYYKLAQQKCPAIITKLPFVRQGVNCAIVYANDAYLIISKDSTRPYLSFMVKEGILGTWDETEHPDLAKAGCVDDIVKILELEDVLYHVKLESLERIYLITIIGADAARELAEQLLEENIRTLQPTFEDAVDRMRQAYELLFRLENGLRILVERKLKEKYGENDWWTEGATSKAKRHCNRFLDDYRVKWHISEQRSPIYCVEFEDLHDIIILKNPDLFKECVGPLDRLSVNLKNLELPRNYIAHNNIMQMEEFYNFRRTVETLLRIIESN